MTKGTEVLNDKEREILRLLLRGFDIKTAARHLDVSANTLAERLRSARRKLGVSSSREGALLLAEADAQTNIIDVTRISGIAAKPVSVPIAVEPVVPAGSGMMEVRAEQATFSGANSFQAFIDALPLRRDAGVGNGLGRQQRVKAAGELAVKLATAFAFIMLAISLVNSIIIQH